jgi:methionyl-tRNA formyltransferase
MKTVFFGSGPVAARSLELLSAHCDIEAVITKPRLAHHKGSVPVLETAERLGFEHVFTVTNKAELSALFAEHKFESRFGVVIDFGIIIAQDVIDAFELGIINSHFSLLPEWRGADPITFSILSGQPRTGISLMLINAAMDEGDLLAQADYDLPTEITTPELTHDLIDLSDQTLRAILPAYVAGSVQPAPQLEVTIADNSVPSYSRKLTKEDGILDFQKTAIELEREVRAFAEWPRSRTTIGGTDVIVTRAHVVENVGDPGTLWQDGKQLGIHCATGTLVIERLIPAAKNEMDAASFLAGYSVK